MTKMTDREIQIVNLYARQSTLAASEQGRGYPQERDALATIGRQYLAEIAERHPEEWAALFPADA